MTSPMNFLGDLVKFTPEKRTSGMFVKDLKLESGYHPEELEDDVIIERIQKAIKKGLKPTWAEYLRPGTVTKIYLDLDKFSDMKPNIEDNYKEAEELIREMRTKLTKLTGAKIAVAVRHRRVHLVKENVDQFKISAHFVFVDLCCLFKDIPKFFETIGLTRADYDYSVYKAGGQYIVCLGCCKSDDIEAQSKTRRDIDKKVLFSKFVDCKNMPDEDFFVQFTACPTYLVNESNMHAFAIGKPQKAIAEKKVEVKAEKKPEKKPEKIEKKPEKVEKKPEKKPVVEEEPDNEPSQDNDKVVVTFEKLYEVVMGLCDDRADVYYTWIKTGIAIINIGDDNNIPPKKQLELFHEFSEKSKKYDFDECNDKFNGLRKNKKPLKDGERISFGTLRSWLKQDDPEKYIALFPPKYAFIDDDDEEEPKKNDTRSDAEKEYDKNMSIWTKIEKTVRPTGLDRIVAEVCCEILGDTVKYSRGVWALLNRKTGFWKLDNTKNSGDLSTRISKTVEPYYRKMTAVLIRKSLAAEEEEDRKRYEEKVKQCLAIADRLNTSSFIKGMTPFLTSLMNDDTFLERLDTVANVVGCDDGVLDLNTFEFRNGKPDDMVTKSIGYNYSTPVDPKKVEKLKKIYMEICNDDVELYNYVLSIYAKALTGENNMQYFYLFTGIGSNGKSVIEHFMHKTFGSYADQISISLFTKESKADCLIPELANKQGVRLTHSNEPNSGSKLLAGQIKHFTGGDNLTARGLFKEPITFKPMFNIIILCNNNLDFDQPDNGFARRFRSVAYKSVFAVEPKTGQKQADKYLMKTFDADVSYMRANLEILIEILKTGKVDYILEHPPKCVIEHSAKYLEDSDPIGTHLRENYVFTGENSDHVACDAVFTECLEMMKTFNKQTKITTRSIANKVMEVFKVESYPAKIGGKSKRVYRGIKKVRHVEDDDDDVEA